MKRTRNAHQVSLVAFLRMLNEAYIQSENDLILDEWIKKRCMESVNFKYWYTLIQLETFLFQLVASYRNGDFQLYIKSLINIVPWLFITDHYMYARYLPIFIEQLQHLESHHKEIYDSFQKGYFTVRESERKFSAVSCNQAHEHNNKKIKTAGGANRNL